MKTKRYILAAMLLIVAVYFGYFINFSVFLERPISGDPAAWGVLGDYAGGTLSPLLSFISIVLLIKSLSLQQQANAELRKELKSNERFERLRSFEALFFKLLEAQRSLFDSFRMEINTGSGQIYDLSGAKAVIAIEKMVEEMRDSGATDQKISSFLDGIDENDQMFGLSRAFYVLVMLVTERLCDREGFSSSDRAAHFKALINFEPVNQIV